MTVPAEFVGVKYRQIADTLRWRRGGKRIMSRRPINEENTKHIDSLEKPTLVQYQAEDVGVDVEFLLRQGAIAPWEPPKASAKKVEPAADVPAREGG